MKIREHHGSLSRSMKTIAEIDPTASAVAAHVMEAWKNFAPMITSDMVSIEKYGTGFDERIGWDTHIVFIEGIGPFGFTDGPLTPNVKLSGAALLRSPC